MKFLKMKNRGFALITVLALTALLSFLFLEFNKTMRMKAAVAENVVRRAECCLTIKSGLNAVAGFLEEDEPVVDHLNEFWAQERFLEAGENQKLTVLITDECAKFNINQLINARGEDNLRKIDQFERLMDILGINPAFLPALLDRLDPDLLPRENGWERTDYSESFSSRTSNGPMNFINEIFSVRGLESLTPGTKEKIKKFCTVFSERKINVNTAEKPVLQSLSPAIDRTLAENIISFREKYPFKEVQDLTSVPGMTREIFRDIQPDVATRTRSFRIYLKASSINMSLAGEAYVKRKTSGIRTISWKILPA